MAKRSTRELTHAEARFHALVYELKLLTLAFPHLKDAVDPEDLPIPFLLERGAARAAAKIEKAKAGKTSKKKA
ncbi:MAG: hypothetical protein WCQ64_00925 [Acidobacteriota bacterium]